MKFGEEMCYGPISWVSVKHIKINGKQHWEKNVLYMMITIKEITIVPKRRQNQYLGLGQVDTTPKTTRGRESTLRSLEPKW